MFPVSVYLRKAAYYCYFLQIHDAHEHIQDFENLCIEETFLTFISIFHIYWNMGLFCFTKSSSYNAPLSIGVPRDELFNQVK